MFERPGKNAHRIALQGAQVDGLIGGGLHLQPDALQATTGNLDLLACGQNRAAIRRLDQRVFARLDAGGQQYHIATARQDAALHRHARRRRAAVAKAQTPAQGISIAHAQGRCGKARRVDHRARAHRNARLVDQHQLAI